ncbi:MAG: radical SAM protein [Deltaproteobacteria bacterium]|nr:radical SAM protein [Deltaproteobacteria bacterium]
MNLTGFHLLLTYQCNKECAYRFVWGNFTQKGFMTLAQIREIYRQARELGTVETIYLEGGEPFLYYLVMVRAAKDPAAPGFREGLVSNVHWATVEDALEWLRPLTGLLDKLAVSTDLFHSSETVNQHPRCNER